MTRLLVERGADLDAKTATDLMTPLVSAEPRAQPRSPGGMTALMFASREGCLDCVAAMVEKGASIDLPDPEGVTPLLWAIWNTRFDVAKYLIEHGANVNRWDWWGRTPLYLAVDYVTLPHGGRPDQPSLDQTLPIDIVRLLLEKGADPNPQLKMTAPLRATGNDRGLDPMLSPGTTPLVRAAKAMDVESMKALLDRGADITLTNSRGMTATLAASGMGSTDADTRGYFTTSDVQDRAIAALDLMFHSRRSDQRQGRPVRAGPAARRRLLGLEPRRRIPVAEGRGDQPCRQPRLHGGRLRHGPRGRQQPWRPAHRRPQGHGGPADVEGRHRRNARTSVTRRSRKPVAVGIYLVKPWELLGQTRTPEGEEMTLTRHGSEYVILAGGQALMSSRMHGSEESLAMFACARARTLETPCCLVGGLGMGFTLRAALDLLPPDATVVVSELVPALVDWNRGPLGALARHPLRDKRVVLEVGDVGAMLWERPGRFDAILLDVDNGPSAFTASSNAELYGDRGLAVARAALKPDGVLGVWSSRED